MRLIDADALVEKLKEDKQKLLTLGGLGTSEEGGAYAAMSIVIAAVQDMPDEHFPAASQWISVNERFPELCEQQSYEGNDGKAYVIRHSIPVIAHDRYTCFTYIARWTDVDGWVEEDGTILNDVDRWMEMPE